MKKKDIEGQAFIADLTAEDVKKINREDLYSKRVQRCAAELMRLKLMEVRFVLQVIEQTQPSRILELKEILND